MDAVCTGRHRILVKRAMISVCAGTLLVHTTFTLFGAPLITAAWKTLALSL
jgi:hypothetical protein